MTDTQEPVEPVPVPPQFTAEYWAKAPRKLMAPVQVMAVRQVGDSKEYVLSNGARLVRPAADVKQLIMSGTTVAVQIIHTGGGEIVTGMFLPEVKAWAWQMDAQQLADYAKEVSEAVSAQRLKVRLAMTVHLKGVLREVLDRQPRFTKLGEESQDQLAEELAVAAVIGLEQGPE